MKNKSKFSIVKILLVLTIAFLGVFFTIREIEGKKIKTVNTPVSKQKVETIEEDINNLSNRIDDLDLIISNQENVSFSSSTLLWENESPTSTFEGQTISIENLSDYEFLMIEYSYYGVSYVRTGCVIGRNTPTTFIIAYCSSGAYTFTTGPIQIGYRSMLINENNSVTFSDGAMNSASSTSLSVNNDKMIPLAIYGLNI